MPVRGRSLVLFAIVFAMTAAVCSGSSQDGGVTFVPWKVLNPGADPVRADLVLNWIPGSRDEMRRSPLLTSKPLAQYATQCIGMQVIRPDDLIAIEKLGATGRVPAAVLTNSHDEIVASAFAESGGLAPASVEKLVRDTVAKLDGEGDRLLDDAKAKLASGDREGAAAAYRKVAEERCLFPGKAHDAERALRKLGGVLK